MIECERMLLCTALTAPAKCRVFFLSGLRASSRWRHTG